MVHNIPSDVTSSLAAKYKASQVADAMFKEEFAVVTRMLGIPDGVNVTINFDNGTIAVPEE
jgi:hypothetical protein